MSDGLPQCYDVGVFPHPFSCKKFVNCYRNPGTGTGPQPRQTVPTHTGEAC